MALLSLFIIGTVLHVAIPEIYGIKIWDYHLFSLYNLEFLCGVMIFRNRQKFSEINWRIPFLAGCLLFPISAAAIYLFHPNHHVPTQGYGISGLFRVCTLSAASSLVVIGLISAEADNAPFLNTLLGRLGKRIGDASFALYLMHPVIFGVAGAVLSKIRLPSEALWPTLASIWTVTVLASIIWYKYIEEKYMNYVTKIFFGRS